MTGFTRVDGKQALLAVKMHQGGHRRLHLEGVGADRKSLELSSNKSQVATCRLLTLFNGPKGIWTVELSAAHPGETKIAALQNKTEVATLSVSVAAPLALPEASTDYGMLVRLFLAESVSPGQRGFDPDATKQGMQWMRVVLQNRLNAPDKGKFMAAGARNLRDIVKAEGQYAGFEGYPKIDMAQLSLINEMLAIANDDNDSRQEAYAAFYQDAVSAASGEAIADPCPTGLYGWRTVGSGSPGANFTPFGPPKAGNQFYSLRK